MNKPERKLTQTFTYQRTFQDGPHGKGTIEAEACPFCGWLSLEIENLGSEARVACRNCEASGPVVPVKDESNSCEAAKIGVGVLRTEYYRANAVGVWNIRVKRV